jgi:acyl-CoA thioester hydrolase
LNERPAPTPRTHYRHFLEIPTRWSDNDAYAHVNNVVYYSYFDTVVNEYLIARGVLEIERSPVIGLVVETHCNFFAPLAFPQRLHAGLRVGRLGRSSVRYEIGIFAAEATHSAAAGHFVHVYVDRASRQPVELPRALRAALEELLP